MSIAWANTRNQVMTIWVSLIIAVIASRGLHLINGALNTSFVVYASVVVPGLLLALLLGWEAKNRPMEFLAGAITLGFSAVLIMASVIVRFRIPVMWFWLVILVFSGIVTALILWRNPAPDEVIFETSTLQEIRLLNITLMIFALVLIGIMIILSSRAFADHPTMNDINIVDKKNYSAVLAMYANDIENVGLNPVDRDLVRPSIQRLLWSGWLYLQAFWSKSSQVSILQLMMRDLRASLIVMWAIITYALSWRLFRHRTLALLALLFTIYFVNFVFASLFIYRLEEGKWMALYAIVPAALLLVLRALDMRKWRAYISLLLSVLALGLIHPIGSPALLLIAFPFVIAEYIARRFFEKRATSIWHSALILGILLMGLLSPLFDRIYLTTVLDAPYTLDSQISPDFGYTEVEPIDPLMLLAVYSSAIMLFFAFRDRSARFIVIGIVVLWMMLYTTPGAYIGARLVTRAQLWRLRLVIPFGLAWAWWVKLAWDATKRFAPKIAAQRTIQGAIAGLFVLSFSGIAIVHHGDNFIPWVVRFQNTEAMPDDMYDALTTFAEVVDSERELVIVDPYYSIVTQSIFVKSQHIVYGQADDGYNKNSPAFDVNLIYETPSDETLTTLIDSYHPAYIIAAVDSPLDEYLQASTLPTCCEQLMTENNFVLYAVHED